jgi:hypothetical protein
VHLAGWPEVLSSLLILGVMFGLWVVSCLTALMPVKAEPHKLVHHHHHHIIIIIMKSVMFHRSVHKFCIWCYCNNKIQNDQYWYSWMFTHMSSTHCNHQHCQNTFPIYMVNDQLQLCIHPWSDDRKESVTAVLSSSDFNCLPRRCSFTRANNQ